MKTLQIFFLCVALSKRKQSFSKQSRAWSKVRAWILQPLSVYHCLCIVQIYFNIDYCWDTFEFEWCKIKCLEKNKETLETVTLSWFYCPVRHLHNFQFIGCTTRFRSFLTCMWWRWTTEHPNEFIHSVRFLQANSAFALFQFSVQL